MRRPKHADLIDINSYDDKRLCIDPAARCRSGRALCGVGSEDGEVAQKAFKKLPFCATFWPCLELAERLQRAAASGGIIR